MIGLKIQSFQKIVEKKSRKRAFTIKKLRFWGDRAVWKFQGENKLCKKISWMKFH